MANKFYYYPNCSTCKKALKVLEKSGLIIKYVDISKHPPSKTELIKMLKNLDGALVKLFNTSGKLYRELKLSEKLPTMSNASAIELLSNNGMLIKRPFLILNDDGCVGFNQKEWTDKLRG